MLEGEIALVTGASRGIGQAIALALGEAGAVVAFFGITRQFTSGMETTRLEYDAYHEMAERDLEKLACEAIRRWGLARCLIVHRLGLVPLTEISVAIVVSSPHRLGAFASGQWLIDALKERVPIWKKECWTDGRSQWIHPKPKAPERHGSGPGKGNRRGG